MVVRAITNLQVGVEQQRPVRLHNVSWSENRWHRQGCRVTRIITITCHRIFRHFFTHKEGGNHRCNCGQVEARAEQ